jgi:uracil-DNA glycosylase family 4
LSPQYVGGCGSLEPKLLIVGEAPGKYEDEQGIPFVGPTGKMLDEYLFKAGIRRSDCYITNVVKYRPPLNDLKKLHLIDVDIDKSVQELWTNEINKLHPNCILAIGDLALQAICDVSGILNYRGSILTARDGITKVVPTIHPAALFSHGSTDLEDSKGGLSWTYTKLIESDIIRAAEESITKTLILPERTLSICHNSLEAHRFFREYEKLDLAAVDIESINCVPVCVGFAFSRHHAISIPLLRSIGTSNLTDMGNNELDSCWRMIDEQLRRCKIIGHNFMYDEYKLGLIGFETPNVYSDTLIKTRVIFPELPDKRLCVVSSLWTREPYYKDDGKEFRLGKSKIDNLLRYNARDCAVEFEVDEAQEVDLNELAEKFSVPLKSYYYDYMMKKHKLYLKFQMTGKRIDFAKQKELKIRYTEMENVVHEKLTTAIGEEINVKSYPQMFNLLYKIMKFKIRKRDPTSEDSIVALLGQTKDKVKKEILNDVLEERRIRDQKSRQISFSPDYDGRCKSAYNISATETCRSSTGILKKPLRPKKIGLADHTISAHGRLAKDIKSMFIADEGMVILAADASQCQARIVAVLSEDWELLEAFDKVDIHRRTAALMFGYTSKLELGVDFKHPIVDNLPKDGPERFTGKKIRHAGNFDMKKHRLMTEFNTDAQKFDIKMDISEWRAGQMLDLFHAASPKLKGVFHRDIKNALDSTRVLIDPFGGVRIFNGRMDDSLYGEGYANIPQRTEAHLIQKAALAIDEELKDDKGFLWSQEKHDALYLQAPANNWEPYARLLKKYMETPIDFRTYCTLKRDYTLVIPCDVEISHTSYAAFEKVKF